MNHALNATNINKKYSEKVQALSGVTLSMNKAEILGLVGINGAGKTTFIKCCVGVLEHDEGTLEIFGYNTKDSSSQIAKLVSWIPQDGTRKFSRHMNGIDNIRYFCGMRGLSKNYILSRIKELNEKLIPDRDTSFMKRLILQMSGGQRQYISLLIGLIPKFKVLFCDEISLNLDQNIIGSVYKYLRELVENGCSILLTSQNLNEIEYLSDRIAILHNGHIINVGKPRDISKKLLEYEIIDLKFDEKLKNIPRYAKLVRQLKTVDSSLEIDETTKIIRLRSKNVYQILGEVSTILKTYLVHPTLEVGKPNLQDALRILEQER